MTRITSQWRSRICGLSLASCIVLFFFLFSADVDREPFAADGLENMKAVYNLLSHSTFSTEPYYVYWVNPRHNENAVLPNMYREPLPIAVVAAVMAVFNGATEISAMPFADFNSKNSRFVRTVKVINCFWLALSLGLIYYALLLLTDNRYLSCAASILPAVYIYSSNSLNESVNWFMTDIQGAALILAASLFLAKAVQRRSNAYFGIAGATVGLASLTKSVVFFAYPLILGLLGCYVLAAKPRRERIYGVVTFSILFVGIVAPWMLRNYVHFDSLSIASRGGLALYARSVENDIANNKLHAAFYWYSPHQFRRSIGSAVGVDEDDFDIDGRYAMINRDHRVGVDNQPIWDAHPPATRSYFGKIFARYRSRLVLLDQQGREAYPVDAVDAQLYDRAKIAIRGDIVGHLKATLLLAYRGMWNDVFPPVVTLMMWALFGIFVGASVVKRDLMSLSFVIIPVAVYLILSLATLFISRYSIVVMWNTYVASIVIGYKLSGLVFRLRPVPVAT